jgi:hypothetical protein
MELVPGSPIGASRINGPTRQIPGTQVLECTHPPPPSPTPPIRRRLKRPIPPGTQHSRLPIPKVNEEPTWMKLATCCPTPAGAVRPSLRFVSGIRTRCHRADAVNLSRCGALAPPEASSSNALLPSSALAARGTGAAAGPPRLARGHAEPVAPRECFWGGRVPPCMWRSAPLCGRFALLAVGR